MSQELIAILENSTPASEGLETRKPSVMIKGRLENRRVNLGGDVGNLVEGGGAWWG